MNPLAYDHSTQQLLQQISAQNMLPLSFFSFPTQVKQNTSLPTQYGMSPLNLSQFANVPNIYSPPIIKGQTNTMPQPFSGVKWLDNPSLYQLSQKKNSIQDAFDSLLKDSPEAKGQQNLISNHLAEYIMQTYSPDMLSHLNLNIDKNNVKCQIDQKDQSHNDGLLASESQLDTLSTKASSPKGKLKTAQIKVLKLRRIDDDGSEKTKTMKKTKLDTSLNESGSHAVGIKKRQVVEDESHDWEEEEEVGEDLFKPTKHCYYVAKKTIREKRVLPQRLRNQPSPKSEEISLSPLELLYTLIPQLEGILGYREIDQEKVFIALAKYEMNVDNAVQKIKSNLRYYKRHFKLYL